MSLGLNRGTVQLEPRDERWNGLAVQTFKILKSILGDDAIDIQHIRSTAIKAKPIIDVAVGVTDFERIVSHNEQLQKESFTA
ncbi:GrpB family protein [Blautia sp.]